jgi:hypothetical protein
MESHANEFGSGVSVELLRNLLELLSGVSVESRSRH